ncbi:MAG: hypothetical protein K8M05_00305, partial [Deltaproteobacteria bacterium]|nr:hypothetical protein [Kofleriaceae bacterium]
MWWIVPSERRVTWGALLATLVTLVGCGGTSLRRPLVTDETPLGTPRERVVAWYAANAWCRLEESPRWVRKFEHDAFRPCDGPDRHRIRAVMVYGRGRLHTAVVSVRVPPDRSPHTRSPIWSGVDAP